MMSTFMSQKTGFGFNVSIQDPFIAKIFSEDKFAPKPKLEKGQYVYIAKSIKNFGGEEEFVKRQVVALQCCTHYVMFMKDTNEESILQTNQNGCTFWYLIQDPDDRLNIYWEKEEHILNNHEQATKHFNGVGSQSMNPYMLGTNM